MGIVFHFLNAGSGDCTIIHFPERTRKDGKEKNERIMMVDICSHIDHSEYQNVLDYYKDNFRRSDGTLMPIFRFVCSHPHQDHICGLEAFYKENEINILNFWDLNHSFEPENFDHNLTHEDDWKAYKELGGDNSPATVIRTTREDKQRDYWTDDEDRITILSPSKKLYNYAHYKQDGTKRKSNDIEIDEISYALVIKINDRKVILAGDGRSEPCWDDICDKCYEDISDVSVLKAGHHGQEASFHEKSVELMNPALVVFSNSEIQDKENGAEQLYKKAVPDALILKTWRDGNVKVEVPFDLNEKITYHTSK